jgi:hypothetical protein
MADSEARAVASQQLPVANLEDAILLSSLLLRCEQIFLTSDELSCSSKSSHAVRLTLPLPLQPLL